ERMCARTGFSRFPIRTALGPGSDLPARGTEFAGYLHIRDVVDIPAGRRDDPVPAARIRELPAVAPATDLRTALDRMRRIGAHLAQVVDPTPDSVPPPAVGGIGSGTGSGIGSGIGSVVGVVML